MANQGFTGAETGDDTELSSSGGLVLDATVKNTGAYSYKVDDATDNGTFVFDSSSAEVFVSFYYRTTTVVTGSGDFVELKAGGTVVASSRVVQAGGVTNFRVTAVGGTEDTGSFEVPAATWMRVEIRYKKGTGFDSIAEIRVNGTVDATSSDGTNSTDDADRFLFQNTLTLALPDNFDDIRTSDTAYPGDGFVAGLRPDAVGDEDNFTPGGTAGVADVNEDPINDSNLQTAPASGSIPFLHNVDALTVSTIDQVRVKVRASRTNGAGREHYIRWKKPGGTAENSADLVLGGGVAFFSFTPSDQPTTQAHIDDMQGGMTQNTVGGRLAECTELWIMGDYTTAAPTTVIQDVIGGGVIPFAR